MSTPRWRVAFLLAFLLVATPAFASHFRGGNVSAQVTETGVVTFTYETLWRKGSAFFPFDGVAQIRFYNATDSGRVSALRTVTPNIGNTTVFRDVSDPAFDFRRQVVTVDLAALGLPQGRYVARWENCCRIAGIQNAPESDFSLESLILWNGTRNSTPALNSRILTVVGKGLPYRQNLNAFDPDGRPLTYQFRLGSSRPTHGPTFHTPGITLDSEGLVFISAQSTATLIDINRFNPAGDYVFKVRVTDGDGAFAERDVLLDVVATANLPPDIAPIGNRVLTVGESVVLPIIANDPNEIDRVTLTTSQLATNMVFVETPGNPASGTLAFRPAAHQVGTFGLNVEARDDGTPVLTDSELVTFTVLDPANGCPVLAPIGNRDLTPGIPHVFALAASDPDGEPLTFSASFLPPGASFDPATRTFSWTPTAAQSGVFTGAVFEVRDAAVPACADREVVGFSVQPANRFPVLAPIGDREASENDMISLTASATDPDGDGVILSAEPLPLGASFDPETGLLMWRPTLGQAGVYQVTFRATDAGSPALTDLETVRFLVTPAGQQSIHLAGITELAEVAGTLLVEAQVRGVFATIAVEFSLDGVPVSRDESAPFFFGDELDGAPVGFDTVTLDDGLHVLAATAIDSAGQTLTTQRKFVSRNFVPPELTALDGIFDGAVLSGTVVLGVQAFDDQEVAAVAFAIDGTQVNVETQPPFYLAGTRLAQGTFDVSCRTCLEIGDQNGDLVVVDLDEDGTLARLCNLQSAALAMTPDGETPAEEDVCDLYRGGGGPAFGLCNAFCEAQDCDAPGHKNDQACNQLRDNFARLTGEPRLPCEAGGDCIHHLTLGLILDPTQVTTFDAEDFTGEITTFELPFGVPIGFDTRALTEGAHTLTLTVTDNQGLVTTVEIEFHVQNTPPPPDALGVVITEPTSDTAFAAARLVPLRAQLANVQGAASVAFYSGGRLVGTDTTAPFETTLWLPEEGTGTLEIVAVARDDRGPRQSAPVSLVIQPRPEPRLELVVADWTAELGADGRVAVESGFLLTFSREVQAGSLAGNVRLFEGGQAVAVSAELLADDRTARITPVVPLTPDRLHFVLVDGVTAFDGEPVRRFVDRFLTFPDQATVVGLVLDNHEEPLPGVPVAIGAVATVTDDAGRFRLVGVATGPQVLHVAGSVVAGRTYPPMEMRLDVAAGFRANELPGPIFLPALDLVGGLDVVGGVAQGGGILTSSDLPGMALDLRGSIVRNGDGSPFTGRMSITSVDDENVPMPSPVYSSSFVTVQPAVHLDPPAPIVYPNLDGALPGESIPLWHFDHGEFDWVRYGTGTVTADGRSIASEPGQGLPETGWGSPQPPMTFTTVVGTVTDNEGSPLHGVIVSIANFSNVSDINGRFELREVPAGRRGTPLKLAALLLARDIEIRHYRDFTPLFTPVQDGTTNLGEVQIRTYAPYIEGRVVLHGDFTPTTGRDHILRVGSPHASEERYRREVEELQRRLMELGFRQGGSTRNHGQELEVNGTFDEANTKKAVKLFQTLELNNGGGGYLGGDGGVGRTTIGELNIILEPELWKENAGFTDWNPGAEQADAYGTPDMEDFIAGMGGLCVNDISNPSGGNHPDHASHETGIDVDVMLPTSRPGAGPRHTPNFGGTVGGGYDRAAVVQMLRSAIATRQTTLRYLADHTVCNQTHDGTPTGVRLCTFDADHYDHVHFRINPSEVPAGVNAFASTLGPERITSVASPGTSAFDVALDGPLVATLAVAFDAASLNATTVRLSGPAGAISGDVVTDPAGRVIRFTPAAALEPATTYRFEVTTGAVLADGTLLAAPLGFDVTTEALRSLRVVEVTPEFASAQVPLSEVVTLRFNAPVAATTLLPDTVRLTRVRTGATVALRLSLTEGGTLLTAEPAAGLAFLEPHALSLADSIRGTDGSPLVVGELVTSFTTALPDGLTAVDIAPVGDVTFTRDDLAPIAMTVTGRFADGSLLDLSDSRAGGTRYTSSAFAVADVSLEGVLTPEGNGDAVIDIEGNLPGFDSALRVTVDGVFPSFRFLGRQFALRPDDELVVSFSEPVDRGVLGLAAVALRDAAGGVVDGNEYLSADGQQLTFTPFSPLPPGQQFVLGFDLLITDGQGVTRAYPRQVRLATSQANLGFERGDLSGFEALGDVEVVSNFGSLLPPEGDFMARLRTSDAAVDGRTSTLRAVALEVPEGAANLRFTYNFLTDEVEQGSPFNDFFRATLIRPDGTSVTVLTVTRDQLRSTGTISPVPGFDRMTGFRTGSVAVQAASGTCHLVLEMLVSDAGDASIDSAVLIDDLRFE